MPRRPAGLDADEEQSDFGRALPQELNDIPQIVARKREGAEFADMIIDAFEVMLAESVDRPLVLGVALYAYLMGHPHRLKHLARALRRIRETADGRVWFTTAGAISDHFRTIGDHKV